MDTKYLKLKDKTWLYRRKIPKTYQFIYQNKREFIQSTVTGYFDVLFGSGSFKKLKEKRYNYGLTITQKSFVILGSVNNYFIKIKVRN